MWLLYPLIQLELKVLHWQRKLRLVNFIMSLLQLQQAVACPETFLITQPPL